MTDETTKTAYDAPQRAVSDGLSARAAATIEVQSGQALLVAQFADIDQARSAYDALREAELKGAVDIDGVLVVKADQHGKVHIQKLTDHTTRHGLAWGAVAGVAIGLLFPPSILVGAVAAGSAGAVLGKIDRRARGHQCGRLGEANDPAGCGRRVGPGRRRDGGCRQGGRQGRRRCARDLSRRRGDGNMRVDSEARATISSHTPLLAPVCSGLLGPLTSFGAQRQKDVLRSAAVEGMASV